MASLSLVVKAAPPKLERQAERDLTRALDAWRVALLRGINSRNLNDMIRRLSNPQWPGNIAMRDALVEVLERGAREGGSAGIDAVLGGGAKAARMEVDWELVNNAATDWALRYSHLLMNGISDTTRDAIAREIAYYTENSLTINQLRDRIAELGVFSKERARRIAVTETTRAYAEGNLAAWSDLDYVEGKRWNTANDDLVCPICGPLNQQVVGKADLFANRYYSPPAHVNCRCGIAPVITGSSDAAALGGGVVGGVTPVSVPDGPSWKPSMSRDEAEVWAAGSKYADDVYHVTTADAARAITEGGFEIREARFGRLLGDGVYVGPNDKIASKYTRFIEEDGGVAKKLVAKIKIDDPLVYEYFDDLDEDTIIHRGAEQRGMSLDESIQFRKDWRLSFDLTPDERTKLFTEYIRDRLGFDSIIFDSPDRLDMSQIVIFDTKKVVVIND